ncbi:hypothetical protein JG688_00009910 [Phytophthora aleatoria]|uniref:Uncharacterized protein n=1 Tax=Phytophthora aleatoria TaxID=2496075 RepID=A0A8J5MFA8_9STRA|nr:hypothetical protein JG688_00009910 [Phytophthora aleatoria]
MAKTLRSRISEGKKARYVILSDMDILSGPYSCRSKKALVDMFGLLPQDMTGKPDFHRFKIGQAVLVIRAIPQLEKIEEVIHLMDTKQNTELLAHSGKYSFATYGQLKLMKDVITTTNNFKLVAAILN